MEHSDYSFLIQAFGQITQGADTLREVFSVVKNNMKTTGEQHTRPTPTDQAREHPDFRLRYFLLDKADKEIEAVVRLMDKCVDDWTRTNQSRADQGINITVDDRQLYQAMEGFMSATETPVSGANRLFLPARKRCRAWMDQAVVWFPNLYPLHIRMMLADESYTKAVSFGQITPPFTWNGSIKGLAEWLDENIFEIPEYKVSGKRHRWADFNGVFIDKDGRPISAGQLKQALARG